MVSCPRADDLHASWVIVNVAEIHTLHATVRSCGDRSRVADLPRVGPRGARMGEKHNYPYNIVCPSLVWGNGMLAKIAIVSLTTMLGIVYRNLIRCGPSWGALCSRQVFKASIGPGMREWKLYSRLNDVHLPVCGQCGTYSLDTIAVSTSECWPWDPPHGLGQGDVVPEGEQEAMLCLQMAPTTWNAPSSDTDGHTWSPNRSLWEPFDIFVVVRQNAQ